MRTQEQTESLNNLFKHLGESKYEKSAVGRANTSSWPIRPVWVTTCMDFVISGLSWAWLVLTEFRKALIKEAR